MYRFGTVSVSFMFLLWFLVYVLLAATTIDASLLLSTISKETYQKSTDGLDVLTTYYDDIDNSIINDKNDLDINARQARQYISPTSTTSPQMNNLQNIITGIFKLLNGSVKIKTNTVLDQNLNTKPAVPHSRINNRGPPQVSDISVPVSTLQLTERPQFSTISFPLPNLINATIGYNPSNIYVPWSIIRKENVTLEETTKTITPTTSTISHPPSLSPIFLTSSEPEISIKHTTLLTPLPTISTHPKSPAVHKQQSTTMISSLPSIKTNFIPKPGIVIDDIDYKSTIKPDIPVPTSATKIQQGPGDIFDITVSAVQGLGSGSMQVKPISFPGDVEKVQIDRHHDIITKPIEGQGFVSIDGKRTYLNLFDTDESSTSSTKIVPTKVISATKVMTSTGTATILPQPNIVKKPIFNRKTNTPPAVRIDTCIVGDDSTCDQSQNEVCRIESNISSCNCRPGFARTKYREVCQPSVSIVVAVRVDRVNDRRILWVGDLKKEQSELYQGISYELGVAMESALSMTPFGSDFLKTKLNNIYRGDKAKGESGIFANLTLQLVQNSETVKPSVKHEIQKQLLGVIQRRNNNIGLSGVWVNSPVGSISNLQDLDECADPELNDCHKFAKCLNVFGSFTCRCDDKYRDQWHDNKYRSGRKCEQCSAAQYCNNRGECRYQNGQPVCQCNSNSFGSQCEIDGEVLMVSIVACVAAIIIIILTLVFLIMWSKKWSVKQKSNPLNGSPVFNYMAPATNTLKGPILGAGPYPFHADDHRIRWSAYPDVLVQSNLYAPEPVHGIPSRPASGVFGYHRPKLTPMYGTLPVNGHPATMPPIPLPRLALQQQKQQQHQHQRTKKSASVHNFRQHLLENTPNHTSSDDEDRTDLVRRNFNTARSKCQLTPNNQSSIYYDVDYEQNELQQRYKNSAMSLNHHPYTLSRPYYRN